MSAFEVELSRRKTGISSDVFKLNNFLRCRSQFCAFGCESESALFLSAFSLEHFPNLMKKHLRSYSECSKWIGRSMFSSHDNIIWFDPSQTL